VGREIESGIVHNKEGGIAFKYVNGKSSVQQRLWPGEGGFHLHAYVVANIAWGCHEHRG
jgi:hypothetical protein